MSRSRVHVGRWVAVVAAITLIGAIVAPAATAQQKFPAVDQPGVTDKEIKVGGVATVSNDPTGQHPGDGLRRHATRTSTTSTRPGGRVRPQARARLRSATTPSPTTAQRCRGCSATTTCSRCCRSAVDLFSGADLLVEGGDPDLRVAHQRRVGFRGQQARAAQPVREQRVVPQSLDSGSRLLRRRLAGAEAGQEAHRR